MILNYAAHHISSLNSDSPNVEALETESQLINLIKQRLSGPVPYIDDSTITGVLGLIAVETEVWSQVSLHPRLPPHAWLFTCQHALVEVTSTDGSPLTFVSKVRTPEKKTRLRNHVQGLRQIIHMRGGFPTLCSTTIGWHLHWYGLVGMRGFARSLAQSFF